MTPAASEQHAYADLDVLRQTWSSKPGLLGWLSATNHQEIGRRYILTAFIFLLIGGIEALLMRLQLAKPENTFLTAGRYNQIFTLHGTTMMFLFAVPVMEGMGIYLVPLMVGTRNVAFPRLNAFGYWMYLAGGLFLYGCAFFNMIPDAGWFAYPPLSGPQFSPGKGVDVWAQMITFTEVSALCVAVELIVTILKMRAPGHVAEPHADVLLVDAGPVFHDHLRDACGDDREHGVSAERPHASARISSTPPRAAILCSTSMCSGSSATRRSTSSSCRLSEWFPRFLKRTRGARSSGIRRWCCRWSETVSSPSVSGCTTCSRPVCRKSAKRTSPPPA